MSNFKVGDKVCHTRTGSTGFVLNNYFDTIQDRQLVQVGWVSGPLRGNEIDTEITNVTLLWAVSNCYDSIKSLVIEYQGRKYKLTEE